jgi:hypothetical protein
MRTVLFKGKQYLSTVIVKNPGVTDGPAMVMSMMRNFCLEAGHCILVPLGHLGQDACLFVLGYKQAPHHETFKKVAVDRPQLFKGLVVWGMLATQHDLAT